MKFKITAEVEIDDESSHLPVTCDAASMKKEGEKVVSDIVKDLLYDIDDIEIASAFAAGEVTVLVDFV